MKPTIKFTAFILLTGVLFYISCKKEYSCENCLSNPPGSSNKSPIAIAGPDQTIMLPIDSISLDGSASSDPDGTISSFQWIKISGPASFTINNAAATRTVVKNLTAGAYQFELKVTDNVGLSAKDTMWVIVNDPAQPNRPPVANAGADQIITLPNNTTNLNGSGSTDPDNNITNYVWTKISGPSTFNIANANAVQTQITNLVQGTYQFELKVTDAVGMFSKDTMQLTVNPESPTACVTGNRPLINVQVMPFGTLSQARTAIAVASAGNKILFAGGCISTGATACVETSRVDIYDRGTQSWSTAELSVPRAAVSAISCGNKVLFTAKYAGNPSSNVDIYDASTNTWSVTVLPERRYLFSVGSVGDKIFFAGGETVDLLYGSDRVDIYNVSTNSWTTASLSEGRWHMNAVTANNKIYFAGGYSGSTDTSNISNRIDIYDNATESWSTSSLSGLEWVGGSIAVANKIYWTGGTGINPDHGGNSGIKNMVEIRDVVTQNTSLDCLLQPKGFLDAVEKDNKIVFFAPYSGGSLNNWFDLYNIAGNAWSIGVLSQNIYYSSPIISVNNTIYVAGGYVNNVLSNQVWKLEF